MQIFQSEILGMILLDSEFFFLIIMLVVLFVVSVKEFFWVMNVKVIFCTKLCFTSPTG